MAAVTAAGASAEPPPDLLALNPNLSIGTCAGGQPIAVSAGMGMRTLAGRAVGAVTGQEVFGEYCVGHYTNAPHFCFAVPAPGGYYTFEIVDANGTDTTLAITTNESWPYCDDDGGNSLLSRITNWYEPGTYHVYVGTFSRGVETEFTMTVQAGEHW